MLQLAGRVGLGVDIADLLQLERALEADGIVDAPADEEHVLRIGLLRGKPLDTLLIEQDALDLLRQRSELRDELRIALLFELAPHLRKFNGEGVAGDELGGVRLRGRYRDLRSGEGIEYVIRLARDGGTDDIDDAEGLQAAGLRFAQCGQRIGGLTGLADDDHEAVRIEDRVPVAELGGELDADRDPGETLHHVLRHDTDMVGRATGNDIDLRNLLDLLITEADGGQIDVSVLHDGIDRITDGLRLLIDLLHHEMLEATLLRGLCIHLDFDELLFDRLLVEVEELSLSGAELRDLGIVDVVHVLAVLENRRYIGGDIGLALFDADDHRCILPGDVDLPRAVHEHEFEGVGAADPHHCPCNRVDWSLSVLFIVVVHEVDGDLGIGLAVELVALLQELVLDLLEVLDDAVVDRDHLMMKAHMRVGVGLGWLAVGRPAGVADAGGALHRLAVVRLLHQILQASLCLHDLDFALLISHGDAG